MRKWTLGVENCYRKRLRHHADDRHGVDLASLSLDDQRDVEVDYNDSYGESGESDSS